MLESVKHIRKYFDTDVTLSYKWRKAQLKALIRMLQTERKSFELALNKDLGKSAHEAWITEIGFVLHEAKHALHHLRAWMRLSPHWTPLFLLPQFSATCAQPRGISLIISPWNYPVQLTLSPLIASIAAGNATIIKPSEYAPETSALISRLVLSYLDTDAVIVIEGDADITQKLLQDDIDFVFFTGSTNTGKAVAQTCAKNLIPYVLELGGKSPCVVFDVQPKNIDAIADRIIFGKFTNAGQTCVAPDYILVEQKLYDTLTSALIRALRRQFPKDESMGTIINKRHFDRLQSLLGHDEKIITGGKGDPAKLRLEPTLVNLNSPSHPLMREEIFGPILPIIPLNTNDPCQEAREIIKQHPTPLACYVFCDRRRDARWLHDHVLSGGFIHNDTLMHVSNIHIPFGGVGSSGQGASHGYAGFQAFSHLKSSLWNTNRVDIPLRYPPYTPKAFAWLERFMRW